MKDEILKAFALSFRNKVIGYSSSEGWCRTVSSSLLPLLAEHGVKGVLEQAEVYKERGNAASLVSHTFIRLDDGRILDPTADQFRSPTGNQMPKVFLGPIPPWYEPVTLQTTLQNKPNSTMNLNELSQIVHKANIKWWQDPATQQPIKRNKGELLALIHSEISEALEGERKDLMDDKLPHRKMAEVELVDAIIRILDYAAGFGYDLQGAFDEKMAFNAIREDHKHEARIIAGGKQF